MLVVPNLVPGHCAPAPTALLVGPHSLFLAAIARLLSAPPLRAVVQLSTRSDEALARMAQAACALLVCDLRSQPIAGAEFARRVTELSSRTRIIMLADLEDLSLLLASLQCGALGFFTKDATPEEFVEGVQLVCAGHFVVGRSLVRGTLSRLQGDPSSTRAGPDAVLSPTEQRILTMVAHASSTRSIAEARGITEKTVRNHLANIYRKLRLTNRSQVILWSARHREALAIQ